MQGLVGGKTLCVKGQGLVDRLVGLLPFSAPDVHTGAVEEQGRQAGSAVAPEAAQEGFGLDQVARIVVERARVPAEDDEIDARLNRQTVSLGEHPRSDGQGLLEELARLASHLDQFGTLLGKGGAIGRKLDFLTQEVFRELNTIGAKCSDSKVAHWVVDAKTHAERVREQVQNLE